MNYSFGSTITRYLIFSHAMPPPSSLHLLHPLLHVVVHGSWVAELIIDKLERIRTTERIDKLRVR
jgi:hypothetical protein